MSTEPRPYVTKKLIISNYFVHSCAKIEDKLYNFLGKYKWPKLDQEKNRILEQFQKNLIEEVGKEPKFLRKTPGRDKFTRQFYQNLNGQITPMWFKLLWYVIKKGSKESSKIMVTNPYKNSTEKLGEHCKNLKYFNWQNNIKY